MANEKEGANFDKNITPSDVASRMEKEGDSFKTTPDAEKEDANTADGYTSDREGRLNNFAVEPEVYVNEPGDLKEKNEAIKAERAGQKLEANQTDEDGKLTMSSDDRTKGTGVI
ncbi:MAG: hypothetical protein SXA11_00895 [Cyanobacteriota bacterium]|nr:hypothetical protein [Cyanobacteriota bacterium]